MHTPGPWTAVRGSHGWRVEAQQGETTVAQTFLPRDPLIQNVRAAQAMEEANAHLIAAAPALLEALFTVFRSNHREGLQATEDVLLKYGFLSGD